MLGSRCKGLFTASRSPQCTSRAVSSRPTFRRGQRIVSACGALIPLLVACPRGGDRGGQPDDPTGTDGIGAPGQAFVLAYAIPEGHTARDFAVIGQLGVRLGDEAQVRSEDDAFAALANVGEEPLELEKAAEIGTAISIGDVVLAKGSRVHGDVTTAGSVRPSRDGTPGTIDGTKLEGRGDFPATDRTRDDLPRHDGPVPAGSWLGLDPRRHALAGLLRELVREGRRASVAAERRVRTGRQLACRGDRCYGGLR